MKNGTTSLVKKDSKESIFTDPNVTWKCGKCSAVDVKLKCKKSLTLLVVLSFLVCYTLSFFITNYKSSIAGQTLI